MGVFRKYLTKAVLAGFILGNNRAKKIADDSRGFTFRQLLPYPRYPQIGIYPQGKAFFAKGF